MKQPQSHKEVEEKMETENKFEALKESEDTEDAETELMEFPSTKQWVENIFKKSNREEGQGDTLEQEKERDSSRRQIADLKCGFKKGRTGQSIVPL
ncbi:hypothetical protein RDI58_027082 [Solanum bulbocastanum]|uniref:Uncharacterized protein n=1 Tax=Solanum bulbocastanum TaxID=147425 RepID=A0AAN8Y1U4_SOLBU